VGIFLLELGNPRVERTTWENLDVAWFHSVSCRTAGFNTVHLGQLADATKFLMVVLMFIGASPGSTGGGVKTVPAAVLALILRTTWRRRQDVELAHRRLPIHLTRQALLIITLAATILVLLTLALTTVEGGKEPFLSYLFEVASALGTVGLTTGITGHLGEPGRLVLIVGMFVGRIGPFTLVLAVARREEKLHYEYPEEGVALG
jgi:trk system potassium uptake protein TrkH